MGGHEHVVECFVGGYDVSKKAQFVVEGKQKLQNSVDFVMLFISELLGEELFEDQDYEDEHKEKGREEEYSYEEEKTTARRKRNTNRKGKTMMMMIPNMTQQKRLIN